MGLTVTGEPASSTATNEQVASNPIPLTFSAEMSATTDCEQNKYQIPSLIREYTCCGEKNLILPWQRGIRRSKCYQKTARKSSARDEISRGGTWPPSWSSRPRWPGPPGRFPSPHPRPRRNPCPLQLWTGHIRNLASSKVDWVPRRRIQAWTVRRKRLSANRAARVNHWHIFQDDMTLR